LVGGRLYQHLLSDVLLSRLHCRDILGHLFLLGSELL
jgi:hypothetical protein